MKRDDPGTVYLNTLITLNKFDLIRDLQHESAFQARKKVKIQQKDDFTMTN